MEAKTVNIIMGFSIITFSIIIDYFAITRFSETSPALLPICMMLFPIQAGIGFNLAFNRKMP